MKHGKGAADMKRILIMCGIIVSLAGCNREPHAAPSTPRYVVLSITEFTGGKIPGAVRCKDSKGKYLPDPAGLCLPSAPILADAVWHCGADIVTIDRSWTHVDYVYFPIYARSEAPSSLEVVRCVQQGVGFSFSAAIAPIGKDGWPPSALDGDEAPFASLYSPKKS